MSYLPLTKNILIFKKLFKKSAIIHPSTLYNQKHNIYLSTQTAKGAKQKDYKEFCV